MSRRLVAAIAVAVLLLAVVLLLCPPMQSQLLPPPVVLNIPESPKSNLEVKLNADTYVIDSSDPIHVSVVSFKPLETCTLYKCFLGDAQLEWMWHEGPEMKQFRISNFAGLVGGFGYDRTTVPMPQEFVFSLKESLKDPHDGVARPGIYQLTLAVPTTTETIRSQPVRIRVFQTEADREKALKEPQTE